MPKMAENLPKAGTFLFYEDCSPLKGLHVPRYAAVQSLPSLGVMYYEDWSVPAALRICGRCNSQMGWQGDRYACPNGHGYTFPLRWIETRMVKGARTS